MSRWLESKSIEMQMEEAGDRRPGAATPPPIPLLESLKMSRTRVLAQLEKATAPAYRKMLKRALKDVEGEIKSLTR